MSKYKLIFKKNLMLMFTLALVIVLGIIVIDRFQEKKYKNYPNIGGSFQLIDINGQIFNSKSINKKKLIYFGYTFCPDVCPFDLLKLSTFIDNNPKLQDQIEFIFITIDPERDDVLQVRSFLENFNQLIQGLTGSKKEIDYVIKNFRIFVKKNIESEKNENYLIDHSSLFFLLDENDFYITHFRPDAFKSRIQDYL